MNFATTRTCIRHVPVFVVEKDTVVIWREGKRRSSKRTTAWPQHFLVTGTALSQGSALVIFLRHRSRFCDQPRQWILQLWRTLLLGWSKWPRLRHDFFFYDRQSLWAYSPVVKLDRHLPHCVTLPSSRTADHLFFFKGGQCQWSFWVSLWTVS